MEDKRTPAEWEKLTGIIVLDPDGWREEFCRAKTEVIVARDVRIAALEAENERLKSKLAAHDYEHNGEPCDNENCPLTHLTNNYESEIGALEAELKAKQTELEALFSVFGTQQLSHASARLEAAESKLDRMIRQVSEVSSRLAERDKRIAELEKFAHESIVWTTDGGGHTLGCECSEQECQRRFAALAEGK